MRVVFDQRQLAHAPSRFLVRGEWKPCPEIPRRGEVLAAAAREAGHEIVEPAAHGAAPWAAVHGADYLEFLETAHARWRALPGTGPRWCRTSIRCAAPAAIPPRWWGRPAGTWPTPPAR